MRVLCLALLWPSLVCAGPFFEEHSEGWFWYQDPFEEAKSKAKTQVPSLISNPTETMISFRQKVEDSLNLAILSPTQENLTQYADNYFEVIRRGQRFTDAYKILLLNHPQYDYSLKFPTNHLVQPLYEQQQKIMAEQRIHNFAKTQGFFFFFAKSCPYCHAFAPIVKQFMEKYGISVVPISLDGGSLPQFPVVVQDNGTAKALNVYSLPALFAVNPKNKQIIPIANGVLSLSELEENISRFMDIQHE